MQVEQHPLSGWVPYKLSIEKEIPLVHWLYVAEHPFTDPFFDDTIGQCRSHTYNSSRYKCVSSLASMIEWADSMPETLPVTFIFHISRCGSTLLAQLIGLNEKYTVLAEVPFFDELLRLPYKLNKFDDDIRKESLFAAIKLLGQNRSGKGERLFIKTDSWHIFFQEILRQLFPHASFVLVYRSPDEVLYSHRKLRGMQAAPNIIEPEVFGYSKEEIADDSLDAYTTKVLEKYLLQFEKVAMNDNDVLLLDYKQGAMDMIEKIGRHMQINWEEQHLFHMHERCMFHSKYPEQAFKKEIKQYDAPGYLHAAMQVYKRLCEKVNESI